MPLEEELVPIVKNKRLTVMFDTVNYYQTALTNMDMYIEMQESLSNIQKEIGTLLQEDGVKHEENKAKIEQLIVDIEKNKQELLVDKKNLNKKPRKKAKKDEKISKKNIKELEAEKEAAEQEETKNKATAIATYKTLAAAKTAKETTIAELQAKITEFSEINQQSNDPNINHPTATNDNFQTTINTLHRNLNAETRRLELNIICFKNNINRLIEKYFIINNKNLSHENLETELESMEEKISKTKDETLIALFFECKKLLLAAKKENLKKEINIASNDNIKKGQILSLSFKKYKHIMTKYTEKAFSYLIISIEKYKKRGIKFATIYSSEQLNPEQQQIFNKLQEAEVKTVKKATSCISPAFNKKLIVIEGYVLISWQNDKNEIIEGLVDIKNLLYIPSSYCVLLMDFNKETLLDKKYFATIKNIIDQTKNEGKNCLVGNDKKIEQYFEKIDDNINNYCQTKDERLTAISTAIKQLLTLSEKLQEKTENINQNLKTDEYIQKANSYLTFANDEQKKPIMKI